MAGIETILADFEKLKTSCEKMKDTKILVGIVGTSTRCSKKLLTLMNTEQQHYTNARLFAPVLMRIKTKSEIWCRQR